MDTLTLNVKTKNMNRKTNTREIAIIHRVYHRLMDTTLAPNARVESVKGVTMLIKANTEHSTVFVPRLLNWNDILSSDEWHFDAITQPSTSNLERSQIEQVIQFPDGSMDLKFLGSGSNLTSRSCSFRRKSTVPSVPSSSKPPEEGATSIPNVTNNDKGKVTGVDFSYAIPKVFYQDHPASHHVGSIRI